MLSGFLKKIPHKASFLTPAITPAAYYGVYRSIINLQTICIAVFAAV
jgi:hypothetical protein